jgi:hypothetical protein
MLGGEAAMDEFAGVAFVVGKGDCANASRACVASHALTMATAHDRLAGRRMENRLLRIVGMNFTA